MPFEIGQRVRARDTVWQVLDARQYDGYTSVALRSLTKPPVERTFIHPIDRLELLPPPELCWDLALPRRWSLLLDAHRLSAAHRRRDLLSIERTKLVIEPYQLLPVMQVMAAPRQRMMLADDVGLGKTVQAGLVMAELIARGRGDRVLIVTPASLVGQWRNEMRDKFDLDFEIFDAESIDELTRHLPAGANPWHYRNRVLASLDYAKQDRVWRVLKAVTWDLVIFDEAHYLAESGSVTHPVRTDRSRFAAGLTELTDSLLLLTATPHNGYDHSFWSLLCLLDPLRFPSPEAMDRDGVRDLVVRRAKRGIRNRDGSPRFKDRHVDDLRMELADPPFAAEKRLYDAVTRYTRREWKRARSRGGAEELAVGFAMTVLKKRAVSSIGALRASLRNRLDNLSPDVMAPDVRRGLFASYQAGLPLNEDQSARVEGQVLAVPAEAGADALDRERKTLEGLLRQAEAIAGAGDHKAARLREAVDALMATEPDRKIIVFTEYRDTLDYLETYLRERGYGDLIMTMHGGMDRSGREGRVEQFNRPGPALLLATDAASEGLNLQFHCYTVIHYELPWNPNRLEQRNGRVDRWGQTHDVEVYNMVVAGTVEDDILARLIKKIERIREMLGTTSDVIGVAAELDIEAAIMDAEAGDEAQTAADRLEEQVDERMDALRGVGAGAKPSLLSMAARFDEPEWQTVERELAATRRDIPGEADAERFAIAALREFGGEVEETRPGAYHITVPSTLHARGVQPSYPTITFRRELALAERDLPLAAVGHPLLQALVGRVKLAAEEDGARWRMTALALPGARPGYLCVYLTRVADGVGGIVEETMLPVFVGLDGVVEAGDEARQLLRAQPLPSNPPADLRARYEPLFAEARERGSVAATDEVARMVERLRREQTDLVAKLRRDLYTWADGRRDWIERRGRTGQLELFGIPAGWREKGLAQVELKVRQREEELARMGEIITSAPEEIAIAAVVPG